MNDAEMINRSGYRRAFRYLKSSVQQSSLTTRFSSPSADKDLAAVDKVSNKAIEVVFFPSYAKKSADEHGDLHVNVHGWLYSTTPAGQQSRRNRYTMVLARSIAGLPALPAAQASSASLTSLVESDQSNSRPSTAGTTSSTGTQLSGTFGKKYDNDELSEGPDSYEFSDGSEPATPNALSYRSSSFPFSSKWSSDVYAPSSTTMLRQGSADSQGSTSTKFSKHYSDHDLLNCHANLTTRISPFLSKAVVGRNVKVHISCEDQIIASSSLLTTDNGHFRGVVKVPQAHLSSKDLQNLKAEIGDDNVSATTDIRIMNDAGVSVISDVDDTVKHTNIVSGMREAFRNAFVRDLNTLEITGVRQWYNAMTKMGCTLHYVSNAPYQLWPCIAAFIKIAGLPAGTISLKQYSGFLQGMFEPAAEKKRANVERILSDFPERKFLLIGDSGEQDLELYCDLARSPRFSKQVLGIFIRDVSTSKTSALASPVGESGEEFFSKGQGDNIIDNPIGSSGLHTLPEVISPPRPPMPPRPLKNPLIDLEGDAEKDDIVATAYVVPSGTHDILQAFSRSPTKENSQHRFIKKSFTEPPASQATNLNKTAPALPPRKPTALKFWSKVEGTNTFEKTNACETSLNTTSPSLSPGESPTNSIRTPTAKTRPGLLRSISGNSYYGDGRKLTKAQERTQAWEVRLARARSMLPDSIKLYIWREGGDCQRYAEDLIRKALKQHTK